MIVLTDIIIDGKVGRVIIYKIQLQMQENETECKQDAQSELTETKRKDKVVNFQQRQQSMEQNPRIFKYPYLISRSSQKIQQDNMSNKSTEKVKSRNPHRKKIFQKKISMPINQIMKQSTQSMNLNLKKINDELQFNPIQNKLHHNLSKKKKGVVKGSSGKSSLVKPLSMYENINKNHPVVFHYSSPLIKLNPRSPQYVQYGSSFPRAQVQVISYPIEPPPPHNIFYYPPTSSIYPTQQQTCYLPPQTLVKSQICQQNQTKINFINKSPNNSNYFSINPSLLKFPHQFSPNHQPPSLINTSSPNKPSSSSLTQPILFHSTNIKNEPIDLENKIKMKMVSNNVDEQRKQLFQQYQQMNINENRKNLVETYKIGENLISNKVTNMNLMTKRNSPNKIIQKIYFAPQVTNQQILQNNKDDNNHEHDYNQFNYQYVEEIDPNYDQIDHYSDRFFDMDVQWTKNKQDDHYQIHKSQSDKKLTDNTKNMIQQKKQQTASLKFPQKQKSLKQAMNEQSLLPNQGPTINKQNVKQKMLKTLIQADRQGKLITLFLINIGLFLIIYQILK